MNRIAHAGGEEGEDTHIEVESGAQTVKIIAIFIIPLVCFLAPLVAGQWLRRHTRFMSLLNVAAAGFIMGFSILHILPDAAAEFASSGVSSDVQKYPVVYALVVSAFMIILMIEKSLLSYIDHHYSAAAPADGAPAPVPLKDISRTGSAVPTDEQSASASTCQSDCCGASGCSCGVNCACQSGSPGSQVDELGKPVSAAGCGCASRGLCIINGVARNAVLELQASQLQLTHDGSSQPQHKHNSAFHSHDVPLNTKHPATAYVLVFGMSTHSIFEGLAIGLGIESYGTLLIFLGVLLHKFSEALAMGVNLQRANISKLRVLLLTLVFASVVPIGVGIGMGVLETVDESQHAIASGVLNGIAAGVLLYVAVLGLIVEEFAGGHDIVAKGCVFLAAAWSMGFISFFE